MRGAFSLRATDRMLEPAGDERAALSIRIPPVACDLMVKYKCPVSGQMFLLLFLAAYLVGRPVVTPTTTVPVLRHVKEAKRWNLLGRIITISK